MSVISSAHLLVEELAGLFLDGVEVLHLSGGEAHDQSHAVSGGRVLVEVMTRGLSSLIDALVYRLTEIHRLQRESDIQRDLCVTGASFIF